MSLALIVEAGGKDGASRLTRVIGLLMTGSLVLAALEQAGDGVAGGRWWLAACSAAACGAWCVIVLRRCARRRPLRLLVTADGLLRLAAPATGEAVDAALLKAWRLGGVIYLHVRATIKVDPAAPAANDPQSPSILGDGDHRFLLARRSLDEVQWHGLRRWLVWHGRSRAGAGPAT